MFELESKIIAVSGGSSGIGLEVTRHLASVGAKPLVVDLHPPDSEASFFACDVADASAVTDTFARIGKDVGPLDGAVACAGVRNFGRALDLSAADWQKVIDINLSGVFYFCREAARACADAGNGGSIVSIASIGAFGGLPQRVNYCAAKAGVVNMTKAMALELAQDRIRINAVAPGATWTPMAEQNTEEQRRVMLARTPLGRYAQPREISNVVLFLLSGLSSYVTGETILVDGGWTAALM
jgi:NAD(P)-dependent dehydrogenase (short-subunit alcohol dehydrogenase family)